MARSKPNPMQLAQDPDVEVRRFRGSRRLVTVDLHVGAAGEVEYVMEKTAIKGAIVRIRPGANVPDDAIAMIRGMVAEAAAIIVLPRPRAAVVPAQVAAAATRSAMGAREAVLSLVGESNSRDRELLKAFCEKVMGEVGL